MITQPVFSTLLLYLFVGGTLLTAQSSFEVLSETEIGTQDEYLPGKFLGKENGNFYFLNVNDEIPSYKPIMLESENLRIIRYNPSRSQLTAEAIDFQDIGGIYLNRAFSYNNRAFISARFPEKNESGSIRAEVELSYQGDIKDTIETLKTIEDRNGKKYGYDPYPADLRIVPYESQSNGVAMQYMTQQSSNSKDLTRVFIGGFNAVRGEVINTDFRINHPFRSVVITQARVNDEGTSFFLVKLYDKNRIEVVKYKGDFIQGYKTFIYRVQADGTTDRLRVFDGRALTRDHFIQLDWEGNLIYVNTHFPDREYQELVRMQFTRVDAESLEILVNEKMRFKSEHFPNQERSEYTGRTNSLSARSALVNVIPTRDGDAYVLFGTDLKISGSRPTGRKIEVVFIDGGDAAIQWVQIAHGPWYSAVQIQPIVVNNDLRILLCGTEERFEEDPEESGLTVGFDAIYQLGALAIDPDGYMELETILDAEKGYTDFEHCYYVGKGEWTVRTQHNYEGATLYYLATFRMK